MCVCPTQDLFDGQGICAFVNTHPVTHTPGITAGVCLFTVSLSHSNPNPKHGEKEAET